MPDRIQPAHCGCNYPCSCVTFEGRVYTDGAYGVAAELERQRDESRAALVAAFNDIQTSGDAS